MGQQWGRQHSDGAGVSLSSRPVRKQLKHNTRLSGWQSLHLPDCGGDCVGNCRDRVGLFLAESGMLLSGSDHALSLERFHPSWHVMDVGGNLQRSETGKLLRRQRSHSSWIVTQHRRTAGYWPQPARRYSHPVYRRACSHECSRAGTRAPWSLKYP